MNWIKSRPFVAVISLFLLFGLGWLVTKKPHRLRDTSDSTEVEPTGASSPPAFHPDSVVEFSWATGGKEFHFSRKPGTFAFSPKVVPERVQERLVMLATSHAETPRKPVATSVKVAIRFATNQVWAGEWGDGVFVWTAGPLTGHAATLSREQNQMFTEGSLAFDSHREVNICNERPTSIDFATSTASSAPQEAPEEVPSASLARLEPDGPRWVLRETNTAPAKPTDATDVERWMGANCLLAIQRFVDPKLVAKPKAPGPVLRLSFRSLPAFVIEAFADRTLGTIYRLPPRAASRGTPAVSETFFTSPRLDEAIKALRKMGLKNSATEK